MIQWEEVTLEDATHVEINGEVFELKVGGKVEKSGGLSVGGFHSIDILVEMNDWANIPQEAFPLLGIRCLRKFKPEPIVFEAIVRQDMPFAYLSNVPDGIPLGTTFRCVQIMEDEE
jgi:hypothetical protein